MGVKEAYEKIAALGKSHYQKEEKGLATESDIVVYQTVVTVMSILEEECPEVLEENDGC